MRIPRKHVDRINDLIKMREAQFYMADRIEEEANEATDSVTVTTLRMDAINWKISGHKYAIKLFEETGIEIDGIDVNRTQLAVLNNRFDRLAEILESVTEAA